MRAVSEPKTRAQRRSPRVPIQLAASLVSRAAHEVRVLDLSRTGCLVRCETLLDHGAILDLTLRLGEEPLVAKVRVAEACLDGAAGGDSARYLAGLEFLGLPAGAEARLLRFLDERRKRDEDSAAR